MPLDLLFKYSVLLFLLFLNTIILKSLVLFLEKIIFNQIFNSFKCIYQFFLLIIFNFDFNLFLLFIFLQIFNVQCKFTMVCWIITNYKIVNSFNSLLKFKNSLAGSLFLLKKFFLQILNVVLLNDNLDFVFFKLNLQRDF